MLTLTSKEHLFLENKLKSTLLIEDWLRLCVILSLADGHSAELIALLLQIPESSISGYAQNYQALVRELD